jgi:hypothetical protein
MPTTPSKPCAKRVQPARRFASTYRVTIAAHELASGRYHIEQQTIELPAPNPQVAARLAVGDAHRGLPRWKPLVRESLEHTVVTGPHTKAAR